jgi:hypothetical protein
MALARTGDSNNRCIVCLSFLMAIHLPSLSGGRYVMGRSLAMGCNPTMDDWRRSPPTAQLAEELKNEITP